MNMHSAPALLPIKPTRDTYDRFQQAYEHFNKTLFGNELPNALITLQRRKGTFGFFSGDKFNDDQGRAADEIALNPARFGDRPLVEILGTLVHEMVHLWQRHQGTPGRGRYHNREWADKMKSLGLQPTDTGEDGGKETGETVNHMIVPGGAFAQAAEKLMAKEFAIIWKEAPTAPEFDPAGAGEATAPEKSGKRVRYCCPDCDLKAWAKHDARLVCGDHMVPMVFGE
ncbi:hypothetical protein ASD50_03685 [Mesorhizobium sp. Root552]|uniref:SprT-like domain-containing protein n=1 Tax=Mesorhizobium sp. Root552 TaxID=1736555 RepID=UPI0006F73C85|nr:SprT-like domain-containing protein [Mesorhizobium sp. Root552]KQZ26520.1 hypothetical protein ASD50_03685 [Mesorhizobium sp. Root552]